MSVPTAAVLGLLQGHMALWQADEQLAPVCLCQADAEGKQPVAHLVHGQAVLGEPS